VEERQKIMKKYWYDLKKDGSQVRASEEQMAGYMTSGEIMKLNVIWTDTATLEDGTRLARTKKAAENAGWNDIALAPFDFK
jgi:hypothetical protein